MYHDEKAFPFSHDDKSALPQLPLPTPENTPRRDPVPSNLQLSFQSYVPPQNLEYGRTLIKDDYTHQFVDESREYGGRENERNHDPKYRDYHVPSDREFGYQTHPGSERIEYPGMHHDIALLSPTYSNQDYPQEMLMNQQMALGIQPLNYQLMSAGNLNSNMHPGQSNMQGQRMHSPNMHPSMHSNQNPNHPGSMHSPNMVPTPETMPELQFRYQDYKKRQPLRINTQVGIYPQPRSSFVYEQSKYDDRRFSAPIVDGNGNVVGGNFGGMNTSGNGLNSANGYYD